MKEPKLPIANDGVYPRCVWCNGENYAPAVIEYSLGKVPCWQCGKVLPDSYVKLEDPEAKDENA